MGASSWNYLVPWQPDPLDALGQLRAEVFTAGTWYWVHGDARQPCCIGELRRDKDVQQTGTHSILDIDGIADGPPNAHEHVGFSVEVTADDAERVFGTRHPSAADLDRIGGPSSRHLDELLVARGIGRHLTLYTGETPTQLLFFGYSGD